METNRQKKIAGVIQHDIAEILQEAMRESQQGVIITVTKVNITPDLGEAKVYISVFPTDNSQQIVAQTQGHAKAIKYQLAQRTRHQLRRVPDLHFFLDDSLDYIEGIEKALKGDVINPIENPDILPKRKKM
jgi:ribosome-binding factor A